MFQSVLDDAAAVEIVSDFFHVLEPDTDLNAVINKGTLLKDIHIRYVMYQLLKSIKYLHSGNVIHRDLKVLNMILFYRNSTHTMLYTTCCICIY